VRGRDRFNADELAWIREQLVQLRVAERAEQKRIRGRLRRAEFRISDWATYSQGFTASEFDALVASERIVRDDAVGLSVLPDVPDPTDVGFDGGPSDSWAEAHLGAARDALSGPGAGQHAVPELIESAAAGRAPGSQLDSPGLYALYADAVVWRQLGLGDPPDERPLYVGKAEDSLVTRDLRTSHRCGTSSSGAPRIRCCSALCPDRPGVSHAYHGTPQGQRHLPLHRPRRARLRPRADPLSRGPPDGSSTSFATPQPPPSA